MSEPSHDCFTAFVGEIEYVFATLRRLGGSPLEVEDLAQEVFIALYRNWKTVDLSRPLRPYLFGIAFRIVRAHGRRRAREVPWPDLDLEDGAASPERALQSKQASALLLAALGMLPVARRAVIILHDLDDVPIADIATSLSLTRFGVYARLRKGRRELAAALKSLSRGKGNP